MDETHKIQAQTSEIKNVLPDVVHSQQIPVLGAVVNDETESELDTGQNTGRESRASEYPHNEEEISEIESISEHIPSKMEYSITESDNVEPQDQNLLKVDTDGGKSQASSLNVPTSDSHHTEIPSLRDPHKLSTSWNIENNNPGSEVHLSEESPVNLAISSDTSKDDEQEQKSEQYSEGDSLKVSQKSGEYPDSLNENFSQKSDQSNDLSLEKLSISADQEADFPSKCSSGSEEIIKLDIRGQGVPKFPLQSTKIIFGPPPEGSTLLGVNDSIPVFQNLLSPFLVGATDGVKVEEVFDDNEPPLIKEMTPERSEHSGSSSDKAEQDLLVEEVTVNNDRKEKEDIEMATPPKSMAPEETAPEETTSLSTLTTDYKTICEEYHEKLEHLEDAITRRDQLIEELTVSLQRSVRQRDDLKIENDHLTNEVHNLQHFVAERSNSEQDTIKAQISDFMKYHTMVKEDSTKFYSAVMSGTTSLQSSNGEKDMDHEEITVNYSKSDLRSSGSSDDFQTGFENKFTALLNKFESYIEENIRNKLRESLIQILCDEIGKMRVENDTEIKELESQMKQDKQAYTIETRRLRELLASVKAGNADIDVLRQELSIKHEKEMENLRTYFEKKCSDMERSYSEEVWRGRACASPLGSVASDAPERDCELAAGDGRRRAKSAELPSLTMETSTPIEQTLKHVSKKHDLQLEDLKAEHVAYVNELQARHKETVAVLEEQITQLKAHIQTAENTEANVSLYQQDIDLELEKEAQVQRRLDEVRREMLQQLQEQLQVLLSDPDAELSSWPLELVALRDKIHGDARAQQEKELSSLREDASPGDADKWRQRRNNSFDQNRQLEEVTKERDSLKRVAAALQRAVGQLLAYCASAEDELNRTVLAQLLRRIVNDDDTLECESRASSPSVLELSCGAGAGGGGAARGKHVHFAPDLRAVLAALDEDAPGLLRHQRDLSADIKRELDLSLKRLRDEAHELLELSSRLTGARRQESKMLESSEMKITELVDDFESKRLSCDNCELHRKNMEEAMSECLQRENLLRSDLDVAMMKIAQLLGCNDRPQSDVIAEGYGLAGAGPAGAACRSLDAAASPRAHAARLAHDLDALQRDRDDLQQQLEAANRQLRATRAFVEEQAAEREAERDEFAARVRDLRDDNARLAQRLHTNARILSEIRCLRLAHCNCREHDAHVEQLEAQTREMNQIITDLEGRKATVDEDLKASEEEITLLRDIIKNLENQLEKKAERENEVSEQLEDMKRTIDERDSKMRALLGELESLRSEKVEQSDVTCLKCEQEEDRYMELLEKVKEQARVLERRLQARTVSLERVHERASAPSSEPSEDVSLRDVRHPPCEGKSPEWSPRVEPLAELAGVWECEEALGRAAAAALRRLADLDAQRAQLMDVAQEVRAERDVLQARMSEQALRISSLSARLQQQRNDAEALAHSAHSHLTVQLHDTHAEVQRLKEELESKDKQLLRLKQNLEEREKSSEQHQAIYGNSCNPKDKVIILERELSNAQSKIAQLEGLARSLEMDKEQLEAAVRDQEKALVFKEDQLNDLMALKLEDEPDQNKEDRAVIEGKISARTLSDIVSISEFDEQDLQMRRAELKAHNLSLSGVQEKDKTHFNKTLPPDVQRPNMSSLNLEYVDHFDVTNYTPRADSLPAHLTSTQNKDLQYKRNVNETTVFGVTDKFGDTAKLAMSQKIQDNCSMFPNREVSDNKNISVEPKKINFSLEATDNKTQEEYMSLKELGITLDVKQENFPDILTQLKHEIKKSRTELETCKSELKNAEEQLCEFPALKEEVEELKALLENTMATMENDKKFYENQLESFSSNKKLLEQRLTELTQEASEKSKDLHLLKEDILRRENMILELAKEKRNLTNKLMELEGRIDELQNRNAALEKFESENRQMREKMSELQKLEQLVSEKNQQIDSLNQHLDRFDDLQRCLNDKTEELENLKEALEEKTNELFQIQDSVEAQNRDIAKINAENVQLSTTNTELKLTLSKLEKDQENASLKLQNSERELERVNSLNNELTSKIDELKHLTDRFKDKETEIEILNEDINSYHHEIAALKEQLKMVSRSPSPRNKSIEEKRTQDRQASNDKKQLAKIKKQISLLQHELDFNKKELNDKAFELAKAKLDVTELKNTLSQSSKEAAEREAGAAELRRRAEALRRDAARLAADKARLEEQLHDLTARLREESNVSELKEKLREKAEKCQELEVELQEMRELLKVRRSPVRGSSAAREVALRSPTAELERALRDQLHYSHTLDDDIMDQILSASSDEHEDIPRLALNTSKSSSSIHSSSSERVQRLRSENEKLQLQLTNLESRLQDKDALITELNRVREQAVAEWQQASLRLAAERDAAARLQLLLDAHKDTADSLQNQDSSMIEMLKRRLESSMKSELEVQEREQKLLKRVQQLESQLPQPEPSEQLKNEMESSARLRGELSVCRAQLELERRAAAELRAALELARRTARQELDARAQQCAALRQDLADLRRLKHDAGVELVRAKELIRTQSATIMELENKLNSASKQRPINDALTEIQSHKTELSRELASLRRCLAASPAARSPLPARTQLELQQTPATPAAPAAPAAPASNDDKEQAVSR
ncbi:uncharacterized protein [Epargyreus clarus]|uniref:uncharacterized protein isoform X2 n=1 Tax=Epargyreus clarus TaxID=520877 RepID=UPI003C2E4F0D